MICCTSSIHVLSLMSLPFPSGANTIIEPLPRPLCTDRIARFFRVRNSKLTACSVGEKNITLETLPESAFGRPSRNPTARSTSPVD